MAWGSGKKIEQMFGTPGLIFRIRLELGLGKHGARERRDCLASIHSLQRSINPIDKISPIPEGEESIGDLLDTNQSELAVAVGMDDFEEEDVPPEQRKDYDNILDGIMYRIDRINYRCQIIEHVKEADGSPAPI